jgi:hypothetical protein
LIVYAERRKHLGNPEESLVPRHEGNKANSRELLDGDKLVWTALCIASPNKTVRSRLRRGAHLYAAYYEDCRGILIQPKVARAVGSLDEFTEKHKIRTNVFTIAPWKQFVLSEILTLVCHRKNKRPK